MRAINYVHLMDISFSTEEEGSVDVHSMARFEIIGATHWDRPFDRSIECGGEESAFRNSSEREKIARSIIVGYWF